MSNLAVFTVVTAVAVLMLIVSIRALTWHTISRFLQTILLLLVLVATWLVIMRDGPLSFEEGLLLALSTLLGLVIGFIRGQAALIRFDLAVGDVVCRRGSLLIFCWAAVAVTNVTLLEGSGLRSSIWQSALPAALTFLTCVFLVSTLTIFSRITAMQRDIQAQPGQETQAH